MTTTRSSARYCKRSSRTIARSWRALAGAALVFVAMGCAAQPHGPFFDDQRFLVFGVDPDAESRKLTEQLEHKGFFLLRRLHGQNFTALGFGLGLASGAASFVQKSWPCHAAGVSVSSGHLKSSPAIASTKPESRTR